MVGGVDAVSHPVAARRRPHRVLFAAAAWLSLAAGAHAQAGNSPLSQAPETFGQNCAVCHGGDAQGTDRAPPLLNSRSLRGKADADIASIIKSGRGNMPSFVFLPAEQIQSLAHFIHTLNADAFDAKPPGDAAAGSAFFHSAGRCANCHTAQGRGAANGPDLSSIGHQLTVADLVQSLEHPETRIVAGYERIDVRLNDGSTLRGFARNRGSHNVVLQTDDGQLHLLLDRDYRGIEKIKGSPMPAFSGTAEQERDLIAFLSTLNGVGPGPASAPGHEIIPASTIGRILDPRPGDWPTYSGNVDGNRHSAMTSIGKGNVASLQTAWIQALPYSPLETTPLVMDGVMYVTGPNQVSALDGRTGSEIWTFSRPRSSAGGISGDAAKGATRGVALLGDRVFFITDDAHLVCLHRLTGAVLWDVAMPDQPGRYGGTSAPLVAGNLVIGGVSGGDEDIRGFVAAYDAVTGERVWRIWTIPKAGEPNSDTWKGDDNPQGGASWLTPSYDVKTGVLYVATGNPYPDTDGDGRGGDNLYTDSDLALDAKTGKLLWHFQFTPHDLHDWDANQPIVLVDAQFHGKPRKLLLHANRNGFFYVLDRTNGEFLQASPLVRRLTWASGVGPDGRPIVLPNSAPTPAGVEACPAVRGATNWYSTAYNPATRLYYVMTVEDCSLYRKAHDGGYGRVNHPDDPAMKVLRALDVDTGKVAWEIPMIGNPEKNYSGVLSTAGGVVFFGESSGGIAAADAATGKFLWHFETNQILKGSPMTYQVDGRQYIAIAAGTNILSFALPEK
jgi:PQQ-dependent dehydrogenase (methanol/ethanol family)